MAWKLLLFALCVSRRRSKLDLDRNLHAIPVFKHFLSSLSDLYRSKRIVTTTAPLGKLQTFHLTAFLAHPGFAVIQWRYRESQNRKQTNRGKILTLQLKIKLDLDGPGVQSLLWAPSIIPDPNIKLQTRSQFQHSFCASEFNYHQILEVLILKYLNKNLLLPSISSIDAQILIPQENLNTFPKPRQEDIFFFHLSGTRIKKVTSIWLALENIFPLFGLWHKKDGKERIALNGGLLSN